ncbi:uncharacterized protein LOC129571658 isoform X2 [Sitodiplosis mosellana]|uniref:uncharacterized protein LOC129571658 isoform X2 n=1 Tax=Sitodiplosis mosellana TaxID=263140 RepID=UPI00244482ED|nr:uncharacterized protein LOC129571658 isoform X2 [Sitodiplosis mosellana]
MYSKMSCIWFLYLSFQSIVICLNTITFASTVPQRASNLPEIKNFTEFLENSLHRKVLNYEISPLSTSNYHTGASIHKVDVHLAANSESLKGDVFNFVIKTWATDPFLIELGNLSHAFLAEERFYSSIIPAIESFEQMSNVPKTKRIDAFIKSFGWRMSLKPNATQSDADALILLENIVHENFVHIDERIGFDREESLAVIKSVAKFNALCIAMKRLQPTLFNTQIKPYIEGGTHKQNTSANIGIGDGLSLIKNLNAELRMKVENQFRMIDTQKQIADLTDTPYKAIHLQDLKKFNIMIRKRMPFF